MPCKYAWDKVVISENNINERYQKLLQETFGVKGIPITGEIPEDWVEYLFPDYRKKSLFYCLGLEPTLILDGAKVIPPKGAIISIKEEEGNVVNLKKVSDGYEGIPIKGYVAVEAISLSETSLPLTACDERCPYYVQDDSLVEEKGLLKDSNILVKIFKESLKTKRHEQFYEFLKEIAKDKKHLNPTL